MADELEIRSATAADREGLITLWTEAFPQFPPWNDPAEMLEAKLAFQPEGMLVGILKGEVIASVMAGYDGHRGLINTLAVAPNQRGKGYGALMLDAACTHLEAQGAVKINLQIRGDNLKLKEYYEKIGFTTEERISMAKLVGKYAKR